MGVLDYPLLIEGPLLSCGRSMPRGPSEDVRPPEFRMGFNREAETPVARLRPLGHPVLTELH